MQDMMVPLATDLCLFALQKSRTTSSGSSLVSLSIASKVDCNRAYNAVPLLITPIRFRIRELPGIRQDSLAVGNGLGETTPPSVGCIDAGDYLQGNNASRLR